MSNALAAASVLIAGWALMRQVRSERRIKAQLVEMRLDGVEVAKPMPTSIPGYRIEGEPRHEIIRVYEQEIGSLIPDFPATMNGGDQGFWTVRWRSLGVPLRVGLVAYDYGDYHHRDENSSTEVRDWADAGTAGLVSGPSSSQPVFLVAPGDEYRQHLTDAAIELQRWRAAP